MAQSQPDERTPVEQVLKLIDGLSDNDLDEVRRKLFNKEWSKRWDALVAKVEAETKGPQLTEDEVADELTAYRREQREKRAQGGN